LAPFRAVQQITPEPGLNAFMTSAAAEELGGVTDLADEA
jgi:hypothetical protein